MKTKLFFAFCFPMVAFSQVNYTVTVTRLKAKADPCDGGVPILCPAAPQDPVFNIWSSDAEANENTNCWIFDNDPEAEYNLWKDIQNLELANETNVNTPYISFDMEGFESDNPVITTCSSSIGDEEVYDRQFVQMYMLVDIPQDTVFTDVLSLNDVYFAEIEIYWVAADAALSELENDLSFVVAPNPNNGLFTIHYSDNSINAFNVTIVDLMGRVVYQGKDILNKSQLDLSSQLPGSYFIQLEVNGATKTQSLILK